MKKVSQYLLLFVSCAFVALVVGIFIGRSGNFHLYEHPDEAPPTATSSLEEYFVYSEEIYIDGKMNINAAGKEDLSLLPGIGDSLAERIIAYREANGYFKDIDELLQVEGIGTGKLSRIQNYLTVGKVK